MLLHDFTQDANEEKVRERRRVQAERQRQLDALRVMNAAQLKEATRTAQGTLLAKIKERQARVHAAIASSAKEELQRLKAEARKAAGMSVEEGDEEEGDQEEGKAECCDKNEDRAQENLQVEGIIAKEEEAIAAAEKAGNTMRESPLSGEESGAEGDADQVHLANDNGDLGLIKQNGEVSGRDFTSSQGVQEDAAKAHRSKSSSESPSSSQSDSDDSDSEVSPKRWSSFQFEPHSSYVAPLACLVDLGRLEISACCENIECRSNLHSLRDVQFISCSSSDPRKLLRTIS